MVSDTAMSHASAMHGSVRERRRASRLLSPRGTARRGRRTANFRPDL